MLSRDLESSPLFAAQSQSGRGAPQGSCVMSHAAGWRRRFKRRGLMFVNRLALVVILGMKLTIRAGKRLRRLICLESQVEFLFVVRLLRLAQTLVAEHEIVMRLQVLGIDGQ